LEHYNDILKLLKKHNYRFSFFTDRQDSKERQVYIRHDVDYSPRVALKMAEAEKGHEVKSTYFFRLRAPFYNVFDSTNAEAIKEIEEMGHCVGLHYEGQMTSQSVSLGTVEKEIKKQIKIFNDLGIYMKQVVSFHRPRQIKPLVVGCTLRGGVLSAYDPKFFSTDEEYAKDPVNKTKYISDSRGKWHGDECVCQINATDIKKIQMLVHPIWWVERIENANIHLQKFLNDEFRYLDESMRLDSNIYVNKIF